jgi:hypothetical protein
MPDFSKVFIQKPSAKLPGISWSSMGQIEWFRGPIDNAFVAVEYAHHAVVANTDQPRTIRTPCHLGRGEMTFRGQACPWSDGMVWLQRCERITEGTLAPGGP